MCKIEDKALLEDYDSLLPIALKLFYHGYESCAYKMVLSRFYSAINNEYTIEIFDLIYSILEPLCEYDQHLVLLLFNKYAFGAKGLGVILDDKALEILNLFEGNIDDGDDEVENKEDILNGIGFSYHFDMYYIIKMTEL